MRELAGRAADKEDVRERLAVETFLGAILGGDSCEENRELRGSP